MANWKWPSPEGYPKWSPGELTYLNKLKAIGYTLKEIATKYGVTSTTIYQLLRRPWLRMFPDFFSSSIERQTRITLCMLERQQSSLDEADDDRMQAMARVRRCPKCGHAKEPFPRRHTPSRIRPGRLIEQEDYWREFYDEFWGDTEETSEFIQAAYEEARKDGKQCNQ